MQNFEGEVVLANCKKNEGACTLTTLYVMLVGQFQWQKSRFMKRLQLDFCLQTLCRA